MCRTKYSTDHKWRSSGLSNCVTVIERHKDSFDLIMNRDVESATISIMRIGQIQKKVLDKVIQNQQTPKCYPLLQTMFQINPIPIHLTPLARLQVPRTLQPLPQRQQQQQPLYKSLSMFLTSTQTQILFPTRRLQQ
jgi:hypothetical protein